VVSFSELICLRLCTQATVQSTNIV